MRADLPDRPPPHQAIDPGRNLELGAFFAAHHTLVQHHLSASECETIALHDLLAMADAQDRHRWETLDLGYTAPLGAPWLRAAAAAGYTTIRDTNLVCFAGAQEALYATLGALLTPTDHAIVVLPSYQSMETLAIGRCAVSGVALDPTRAWALDIDELAAAIRPNTRLVIISFPNNPTGKLLEPDRFEALVTLCRRHGIWLLSDEVYRLTERNPAHRLPAAADAYERGISLGVLSKAHGLPGLRIGWVACRDAKLLDRIAALRQYLSTCNAAPSEVLATIALKSADRLTNRNRHLAEANLTELLAFFSRHHALFDCEIPQGGVVCYPRYLGPEGVEKFVATMAETHGILFLPASVFRSELLDLPTDRFRIGYGKLDFSLGLRAFETALQRNSKAVLF